MVVISDDPRRFDEGSELLHENGRPLVVESARAHRDRFLVKFRDIDTRSSAEELRGALFVDAERTRRLDDDEFWIHDLVGCALVDGAGERLGLVTGVTPGPAQDLLVVDTPAGERFVPFVEPIVRSVDATARTVTIDPPPGLLD